MHIDELNIRNFRCFDDKTFQFDRQFNVICGNNATGKSSILDAIKIAINIYIDRMGYYSPRLNGQIPALTGLSMIRAEDIRRKFIDGQPKVQLPVLVSSNGLIHDQGWDSSRILTESPDEDPNLSTNNTVGGNLSQFAKEDLAESRKKSFNAFPLIASYGTDRLCKAKSVEETPYQIQEEGVIHGYKDCLSVKLSNSPYLSWFKTIEDEVKKFKKPLDKAHFSLFKNTISSLVSDWSKMEFSYRENDIIGEFISPYGKKDKQTFRTLSDGYQNVISMCADMVYRCIQLNPGLGGNAVKETAGIVLIDEIDQHLHPKWQMNIVSDLKRVFPKIQFIATTHSPFIIQSMHKSELIILDKGIVLGKDDPFKKSIKEITSNEMGLGEILRSHEFIAMEETAAEYFKLIKSGKTSGSDEETQRLRNRLNELEEKFRSDPGFNALLKIERKSNGL